MQKLLEMAAVVSRRKRLIIFAISFALILTATTLSAVVLNTEALLLDENDSYALTQTVSKSASVTAKFPFALPDAPKYGLITTSALNAEKEKTLTDKEIKLLEGLVSPDPESVVLEGGIPKKAEKTKKASEVESVSRLTPPKSLRLDSKGVPTEYKKVMKGTATAYGPKDGTATSTGKKAKPGYVAVDPKVIPYGTKMYIVSADGKYNYGYAIAADTGGAARSGRILVDLYFPTNKSCMQFGRRQVKIYILS